MFRDELNGFGGAIRFGCQVESVDAFAVLCSRKWQVVALERAALPLLGGNGAVGVVGGRHGRHAGEVLAVVLVRPLVGRVAVGVVEITGGQGLRVRRTRGLRGQMGRVLMAGRRRRLSGAGRGGVVGMVVDAQRRHVHHPAKARLLRSSDKQ